MNKPGEAPGDIIQPQGEHVQQGINAENGEPSSWISLGGSLPLRLKDVLSGKEEESSTSEKNPSECPASESFQDLQTQPVNIQGHGFPGGKIVTDAAGRSRILYSKDYGQVYAGCWRSPEENASYDRLVDCIYKAASAKKRGNFSVAERGFLDALEAARELYYDFEKEYHVLLNLATLYGEAGKFDKALETYMLALENSRKCFGKNSANCFTVVNALAVLYEGKSRFTDAGALYRRSLAGRLKIGGPAHPDTLMTMQELAGIHLILQRPQAALPLLKSAYTGLEKSSGPEDRITLLTLNNLASTYRQLDRKEEARLLLEPTSSRFARALGPDDTVTIHAVCNLLLVYDNCTIPDAVMTVLDSCKRNRNKKSLEALSCLARFYGEHNLIKNATETYKFLFEVSKQVQGCAHQETLKALYGRAFYSMRLDRLDEAEALFQLLLDSTRPIDPVHAPQSENWPSLCIDALDRLHKRREMLSNEANSWGLNRAGACSAAGCDKMTVRFCSG
jgi:tetratricopeptide (TPR) repeat protein